MAHTNLIKIYGIKNCDSCKKARKLVAAQTEHYEFIDIRDQPLSTSLLTRWCKLFGMQSLVNRRSTTWRSLSTAEQQFTQVNQAVSLLESNPTLMKRPVTTRGSEAILGFDSEAISQLVSNE